MKVYNYLQRFWVFLLCLVLYGVCLPQRAQAYVRIDPDRPASMTLEYKSDTEGFADVEFSVYHVADVSDAVVFTLTEEFSKYRVSFTGLDSEGWRELAGTLAGYVAQDGLEPLATGKTDAQGQVTFSDLLPGLYLITGAQNMDEEYVYTPMSWLGMLPFLNSQDEWEYDVTSNVKYTQVDRYEKADRKVLKVWSDTGYEGRRPQEITVQLLRDGQVYDTVTLNAANNWRHTWPALSARYRWQVTEQDVPSGYTAAVKEEGTAFVVTNTYVPSNGGNSGGGGGGGGTDGPGRYQPLTGLNDSPVPLGMMETIEPEPTPLAPMEIPKGILPQTGQLWWPVPLMAAAGLLCFFAGWIRHREWNDRHEE